MGGSSVHPNLEPDEMSRQKSRGRPSTAAPSPFDQARDELFQHVMRCGVIGSAPEHQAEWFDETMKYLADRYHELSKQQVTDLRTLGERFAAPTAKPATAPAPQNDETTADDAAPQGERDTVNAA
jgi:hypothetical protein